MRSSIAVPLQYKFKVDDVIKVLMLARTEFTKVRSIDFSIISNVPSCQDGVLAQMQVPCVVVGDIHGQVLTRDASGV